MKPIEISIKDKEGKPVEGIEVNAKMQTPKEYADEVNARLEEIGKKYSGELTKEQRIEKKLAQQALANEVMEKVGEDWKKLTRKQKRQITAPGQKFSERVRKRLK